MTKIKNTKKGMAKKTLSMSLVVAMLATSNVPVWAAEFSDGSDVAVETEAPVVADTDTNEFSDNTVSEEIPVVEETETVDSAKASGDYTDNAEDVNVNNYTINDLKIEVGAWDTTISVKGTIKAADGTDVKNLKYVWLAGDHQAAGKKAIGTTKGNVGTISYTPDRKDFNETLSVMIYEEGANGAKTFSKTIVGGTVQPKKLGGTSAPLAPVFTNADVTYTGKDVKVLPDNVSAFKFTAEGITSDQFTWNYTTAGNDFTNVTGKDITVIGKLEGTYDKNSTAYGYTYESGKATYKVVPKKLTSANVQFEFKKTSVPFINGDYTLGKDDVSLYVTMNDDSKVNISELLKSDAKFSIDARSVGKGKTIASLTAPTVKAQLDSEVNKNFDVSTLTKGNIKQVNTYEVTVLDLSTCTGEVTKEYTLTGFNKSKVAAADILLTTADGVSFRADQLGKNINIAVNQNAIDAAKNKIPGVVYDAVTVSYREQTVNVTNSINLPITLTTKSLANATATVKYKAKPYTLGNDKATDKISLKVPYIATAYDLQKSNVFSNLTLAGVDPAEYEVSYDNNVDAGIVTVTFTGIKSYEGSVKKVYFEITPATANTITVKDVTVNPSNNHDVALYKDALKAEIKTKLDNGTDVVLEEDKDYTVKYYYVNLDKLSGKDDDAKLAKLNSEAEIKKHAGTNVPGDYVFVVATPVNKGNYKFGTAKTASYKNVLIGHGKITNKSISDVTITVEKDSYTFTGKEIVPNITVKDGSSVLEKGKDYTVKIKDGVNVGTATITIYPTANSDYDPKTTATATFKIEAAKAEDVVVHLKADKTATTTTTGFAYTGKQVKPVVADVKLNGVDVTQYFDITYPTYGENVNAGKNAGSITIAPKTTTANFTGTKTQLFDITGVELNGTLSAYYNDKTKVTVEKNHIARNKSGYDYSFYYDGTEQRFANEIFTASTKGDIEAGNDYEIKYINNVNAGYGFVAVVAKGNYVGKLTLTGKNWGVNGYTIKDGNLVNTSTNTTVESSIVDIIAFNIQPTVFTAKNISISNGVYSGGLAVKPQVNVTVNGAVLTEGKDYSLELWSIDGKTTPEQFTNATANKPYYVTVEPKGGYTFDNVNGTNTYVWGIDKKDLKDCTVVVDKNLKATVTNGNVIEEKENFAVKDNGDGTATVSVVDGGKNYTGSVNVEIGGRKVGAPMISNVKVVGNKATVILSDEVDGASGYDYVISTDKDCIKNKNYAAVNKNQAKTSTAFKYVDQGTYYAYCHAWTRDANGKKVFGEWSNGFQFSVTATTPDAPVIKSVKVSGSTVKVTYELSANATGYDVVLGTSSKKDNGELRPYNYGAHKVLNLKESTVTATFKNVPAGTWTVGMHAFNRTSIDGKKVFSPWSNLETAKVK